MDEKRTIDGYAVLHAIRIDGAEQIVAEKDSHYRLYRGERVSTLGIEEYTTVFESRDYLKTMREFTRRINSALDGLDLSRVYRGSPLVDFRLEAEDCVPGGMADEAGLVQVKALVNLAKAQGLPVLAFADGVAVAAEIFGQPADAPGAAFRDGKAALLNDRAALTAVVAAI